MAARSTAALLILLLACCSPCGAGEDGERDIFFAPDPAHNLVVVTWRAPHDFVNVACIKETYCDADLDGSIGSSPDDFFCREIVREDGTYMKHLYRRDSSRVFALYPDQRTVKKSYDFSAPSGDGDWQSALAAKNRALSIANEEYNEILTRAR
ncbi:MAG: hypothetical protein RDV48_06550 [Candidatus Eremiobacteraeota bacterium]|nr:hypothetical protein [Candidatus Eremiobacteraeota bacterium]